MPFAFTEHGALTAASVLNTPHAVEVSLYVVRASDQYPGNPCCYCLSGRLPSNRKHRGVTSPDIRIVASCVKDRSIAKETEAAALLVTERISNLAEI